MLKFGIHFIRKLLYGKARRKIRTDSYWTDSYPSPEPSWLKNAVNKTGNKIFSSIDNFFQGNAIRQNAEIYGDLSIQRANNESCMEWVLHQGIADIAINDISSSLKWILPGFIKKYIFRMHQLSLLYFFMDSPGEEEFTEWAGLKDYSSDPIKEDKRKVIHILQDFRDRINSNFMSFNLVWRNFITRLKVIIKHNQEKKTYYLLGYFAPQEYEHAVNSQNFMIRGPDKSKLTPAFSFHKRI
jgi:hypothetical protein